VRPEITGKIKPINANTYTVALAENLPKFNISVPAGLTGSVAGTISFAPLCQANNSGSATAASSGWRSCYLGSVTIGPKTSTVSPNYIYGRELENDNSAGSFSLVWEDSQWGNDHDNDVVTMITYCVGAKCTRTTGTRNGTGTDYAASYAGYDICWRSDSTVCGADGQPAVNSDEVLVRIENLSAYAGNAMLTGYSITGSNNDGAKRVALRPGNTNDSILTASANPRSEWARPHVMKYKVGASTTALLQNPLWYAAKYGAFAQADRSKSDNIAAQGQTSWDKDSDGVPDAYFKVTDPAKLKQSLNAVFVDVLERGSSAAAIATNSTRIDTDTLIFQAKFNSADWSGQIIAYRVNPDGTIGGIAWDTNETLPFPASPSSREIFTWNESLASGVGDGTTFVWNNLSAAQQAALGGGDPTVGQNRVNWLRGSRALETSSSGGVFRRRNYVMGDIVNSDPAFIGATNFGYNALPVGTLGQDTYTAFKTATTTRTKALYVGANDGMLHAFNAVTGEELFSYVPRGIYGNLASLTSPSYSHRYFVDGAANFGDAYFASAWHTVLVGTTGAGGSSIFALDVTDPDDFDADNILWEIGNNATFPDLGFTTGYATVGRLKNGQWVAIFGNGYNSPNGRAVLYVVNVQTGAKIAEITACETSPCTDSGNGLSTPALLVDSQRNIIAAYAGDLKGNLWEFNLDGAYEVANRTSGDPAPLYKSGRPITAPVDIGIHPAGGYMVYFGTGKYYETGDNSVGANPPIERFYGVRDEGDNRKVATSDLVEQTIIAEQAVTVTTDNKGTTTTSDDVQKTYRLRGVSANPINWSNNKGWYLTLTSPVNVAKGERVVSAPRLRLGRVIFPTVIPSSEPCDAGGTSWLMEIDALTGGRLGESVFDLDGNLLFNVNDNMAFGSSSIPPSGMQSEEGIIKTPAITSAGPVEYKFAGGSRGGIQTVIEKGDSRAGRQSWRQLR
jgi:type IV pilus assembly protein PilY1